MNTTLISSKRILTKISGCLFALLLLLPQTVAAQEALTLSISPSLFDMSVNPNQEWRSSLRVINVNDYDLTVYLDVVNFMPQGEGGSGRFIPISDDTEAAGSTLAEWFVINRDPIVIPREQSLEIPIAVRVPEGAAPGGHFAAILVGTKPPTSESGQARVQTSQMVTSLFFARVAGDIRELGLVRNFTTSESVLDTPEVNFELRFENKGNVHLQPQGEIKITNMWGQERGIIPINQSTQFGNVLPESIRKFNFAWKGEWSFSDIGRYTAEVTLAYGTEARQFATAITTFWVIPFKLLFGILLIISLFALATTWLVRRYVRRMLSLAGIDVNEYKASSSVKALHHSRAKNKVPLHQPMIIGLADFKQKVLLAKGVLTRLSAIGNFIIQYRIFFAAVVLVITFLVLVIWFVSSANTDTRGYEIEYVNADANLRLTSEEIIYRQLKQERETSPISIDESLPPLKIVNRSGVPGLGAEAKLQLEARGYKVVVLEADFATRGDRTVVVYPTNQEREAKRLSAHLNNAPISAFEAEDTSGVITVYVGDDIRAPQ
jgi:hypothetical protein